MQGRPILEGMFTSQHLFIYIPCIRYTCMQACLGIRLGAGFTQQAKLVFFVKNFVKHRFAKFVVAKITGYSIDSIEVSKKNCFVYNTMK